ncbi:MAG: DUF1302 family protein [Nevskia sp.]|nr:DUF1302 family protein [Nevskia sp.]
MTVTAARAVSWDMPLMGDDVKAVLNTAITAGGAVRMQSQNVDLIGKSNLDPQLCTGPDGAYQSCQGLFRNQIYPARRLVAAPGAASISTDDGDLNYNKGDLVSAVVKATQDLNLSWRGYGLFTRWLYFYDAVNADFTEYHPNRITPQNYLQVGRQAPGLPASAQQFLRGVLSNPAAFLANPFSVGEIVLDARPFGQPGPNGTYLVYGPGGVVRQQRAGGEERREIGSNLQWLDAYVYGSLPLWEDKSLSFKLGRQTVSWGESTTLVLNSINQANPINANNFYRIGRQVEEVFTPVAMADFSFEPVSNYNVEAFYQLEWKGDESVAPGSFFSDNDIGTNNIGNTVSGNNGNVAEDPGRVGTPLDSPLAGLSNTTSTLRRVPDAVPSAAGQYGLALKHYFEKIGSGLEVGLYFMNYHSRLPLASFYADNPSCARRDGNALGNDATGLVSFLQDCPDIPLIHSLLHPGEPAQYATSSAAPLDSARFQLEYPRDIKLYGVGFNTTVGDWSIQGEVAYRPNLPLQVALPDLAFAAFGPSLTSCHDRAVGCTGSAALGNIGIGYAEDGSTINYGSSDFVPAAGTTAYPDLINVGVGHIPGSARAFPSFVIPYRGGQIGDNPACPKGMRDSDYHPGIPCYIRGYEREQVYQFNFGTTRVLGPGENPFGADQVTLVSEWGATWVPYLPALDRLQFQAPGAYYHASAGADGSGADGSRQACSTNPACSIGPDGLRFNPHQQDPKGYPTSVSWGYRIISLLSYENVLPRIGLRPAIVWAQDVQGTSPGPGGNFVMGSKEAQTLLELRYLQSLSLTAGYTWYFGGGQYNTLKDRDYLQFFARYQF